MTECEQHCQLRRLGRQISMSHAAASNDIAKVLSVTDTRQYEEGPDDKWYPIPGSGTENECARCGKLHVIHARVELTDGSEAIVGTTCADRGSLLFKQLRSASSRAKRRAKLESQLASTEAQMRAYQVACEAVNELPRPPVTEHPDATMGERQYEIRCGDATVWTFVEQGLTEERRRCALNNWRRKRLLEMGANPNGYIQAEKAKQLRKELEMVSA